MLDEQKISHATPYWGLRPPMSRRVRSYNAIFSTAKTQTIKKESDPQYNLWLGSQSKEAKVVLIKGTIHVVTRAPKTTVHDKRANKLVFYRYLVEDKDIQKRAQG